MDQKSVSGDSGVSGGSISPVHVDHFSPTIIAQSGSTVLAPTIIGSSIGNINMVANSTHQGTINASRETSNHNSDSTLQPPRCRTAEFQQTLKEALKRKYSHSRLGLTTAANKKCLKKIYTELYITEGGSGQVNEEHEVRQIETASRLQVAHEKLVHCNDLFVPTEERDYHIRTVITRGIAGIGKTFYVNKFILDWAEEKDNKHMEFVFPLSFRELNMMTNKNYSLEKLVSVFFPDIRDSAIFAHGKGKVLFILDGLDESRLTLDFQQSEIISDVTEETTVSLLLTNLIRGKLLENAFVWITSRPVASSQIPLEFIDLITEVRGFNDLQKGEYFQKNISDKEVAKRVITHVQSCRSLHIMCHIPVFCWMVATVLEEKLTTKDSKDTPRTLTQMYIHFLSFVVDNIEKRQRVEPNNTLSLNLRETVMSMAQLAYRELEKGHFFFYESDLIQDDIKITQASMLSGIYTRIFSEEMIPCKEKMFSFVHLSVQEFLAALYVYLKFNNDNYNVLAKKSSASRRFPFRDTSEVILYKEAVRKALENNKGHYDIFLRFLLGLSLDSNQALLKHLMTSNKTHPKTRPEIIKHIKTMIRESSSPDRCLNLFHCLSELNDYSLVEEIQGYFTSGSLEEAQLSPAQWTSLVVVLLTTEKELSVFELSKYRRSEETLLRLLPVVKASQVANLNACKLTANCCEQLAKSISSSQLRELDLSNNNLTDGGIAKLSDGLRNSKLETLRLRSCNLTGQCSDKLAWVISSANCKLTVLDLSDNDFQDEGVKTLCGAIGGHHCKLEVLDLSLCGLTEESCNFLAEELNSLGLRKLDLRYNHPGDSCLQLLSTLRDDPQCSLQELRVEQCGESWVQRPPKKYYKKLILDPNTAHRNLCLSEGNRKARYWTKQPHPDHPERFEDLTQVLCTEGLTGRCYWETEWTGRAFIGVAYKRICRKGNGDDSWLGKNDCSWGLECNKDGIAAWHKGVRSQVKVTPISYKVGVFLDWSAGTLSFLRVDCEESNFHKFHTTFTEPVYPGFRFGWVDSTVCLC